MRIEFCGLPGVGKTYITNILTSRYPEIQKFILPNKSSTQKEKLYAIPFFLTHPSLYYSIKYKQRNQKLLVCFKRFSRRYPYIIKNNNCLLVDCGLMQPLIEAHILWNDDRLRVDWKKLVDSTAVLDHNYFLITDSLKNTIQRELNRKPRRFNLNPAELSKKYFEAQSLIDLIKQKNRFYEFLVDDYDTTEALVADLYLKISDILKM